MCHGPILPAKLDSLFYDGTSSISAEDEGKGVRRDVNGHPIRRDSYRDEASECGWVVEEVCDSSGQLIRVPLHPAAASSGVSNG
jgi:hypothetical protein